MNAPFKLDVSSRLTAHYAAVKSRLWGAPPRPVMLKVEPEQVEEMRAKTKAALAQRSSCEQQNDFIKARCREMGFAYKAIMAADLSGEALEARNQIMKDLKERWPYANVKHLAFRFNRSQDEIREILASFKGKSLRPITPQAVIEMRQMRAQGMKYAEIGERYGVTPDTVSYHLSKGKK